MKIVLVNPPQFSQFPQPPMGLAIIAAVLEREGYGVTVIDGNTLILRVESLIGHIAGADVVGLTAMTPTINAAVNIARQVKHSNPNTFIILGGAHATLLPEETLTNTPEIDIIVKGEGEETIVELVRALEYREPIDNILGISFRRNGEVVNNPPRPTEVDLDSLPFLAYHLLPMQRYKPHPPHGRVLPFAALMTSRGCPYRCAYCSKPIFRNRFRAQSPERVVEEIAYHQNKFGIKEITFYDDVFTLDKKRAFAIADGLIRKGLKIRWTCETRVNLVNKELLLHMRKAGCYAVSYGIESGSQEIIDIIQKDITLEQVGEAIRMTRDVGMQTVGYFMIGSPGETPLTIHTTIGFAKKLGLDFAQFAITTPFPGTKLYDLYLASENKDAVSWEDFMYDGFGEEKTPIIYNESLGRKELQYWVRRAYKEFYLRPSYLWQRIRQVSSLGDLKVNIKGFIMLSRNIMPVQNIKR